MMISNMLAQIWPYSTTLPLFPIVCLVASLVYGYLFLVKKRLNLPPRPQSWPIIGNFLASTYYCQVPTYRWCMEQARTSGPIIRVTQGLSDVVFLNDRASAHAALVDHGTQFLGRPVNAAFEALSGDMNNVSFTDPLHPTWKLRRKMLVSSLKSFTTGDTFESRIEECLEKLYPLFDEPARTSESFDPADSLKFFVHNNMAVMCYGKSFDTNDRAYLQLHEANQEFADAMSRIHSTDVLPVLKYLPFDMSDIRRLKSRMAKPINDFIEKNFMEHVENPSVEPTDLTYHLLKLREESDDHAVKTVTLTHIREMASEVYNAGTDTSRGTLQWILLCLSHRPDVQERLHREILLHLGQRREKLRGQSLLSKRNDMVYCKAVLTECMRFGTVAPIGLPRKTLEDCKIGAYDIPKDTEVFINQYAINHNPADFPAPDTFNPDRFLPDSADRSPQVVFGLGRRSCPGEPSARSTLFLVLVALVERYRFAQCDEKKLSVDMYVDNAFDGSPKPFSIRIERRT